MVFLLTFVTLIVLSNSQSYYLSSQKRTWSEASEFCINTCDSILATIPSNKAYKITEKLIKQSNTDEPVWIGLLGNEWIDKTEYKYTRLHPDTSINDKCSVVTPDNKYTWTNKDCKQEYRFMCNSCDGILTEDSETNNQWTIIKGNENALSFPTNDQNGFLINSESDDTIAIINQKQWKQCKKYRPWVVEMKYNYNEKQDYNIGYVFYNNKNSENDYYFIRVKSAQIESMTDSELTSEQKRAVELSLGYNEEIIALGHISDFQWTDLLEETLKVEIEYGLRFKVYLNNELLLKTGFDKNPFGFDKKKVMSGYVGVQSLHSNIKINKFTVSGMPIKYDDNTDENEWMINDCFFDYIEAEDDMLHQETTTTTQVTNGGEDVGMNLHPDMDVLPDTGNVSTLDMRILIISGLILILCCMIFVSIYYYKLKRDRRRKLDRMFGRDSITKNVSIDITNDEGNNVTLPVDGFGFNNTNNQTVINMNPLNSEGPQPIGIDMDIGRPSLDPFQFSDVQIDNFEQYNTYEPKNTWDIAAIEAGCDDIIKNSKGRNSKRHSRHASFS